MSEENLKKPLIRPIAAVASILGIIQGLAWTIMSVLAICCYFQVITNDESDATNYGVIIYNILFSPSNSSISNDDALVINPYTFFIFTWFYFIFSFLWIILSSIVLWEMIRDKWAYSEFSFGGWSTLTISISLLDVIIMGVLARDYTILNDLLTNDNSYYKQLILVAYGILISLAVRGYILWIVNVIFAVILYKFMDDISSDDSDQIRRTIINAYDNMSSNEELWSANPNNHPFLNNNEPSGNNIFERLSQSFVPTAIIACRNSSNNNGLTPQNSFYSSNNNNSDINKSRLKSALSIQSDSEVNKVRRNNKTGGSSSPIIPDPDYTPPATPNMFLKSVLKSKSRY